MKCIRRRGYFLEASCLPSSAARSADAWTASMTRPRNPDLSKTWKQEIKRRRARTKAARRVDPPGGRGGSCRPARSPLPSAGPCVSLTKERERERKGSRREETRAALPLTRVEGQLCRPQGHLGGEPDGQGPRQSHPHAPVGEGLQEGVDVGGTRSGHPGERVLLAFLHALAEADAAEQDPGQLAVFRGGP